MSGWIKLSRAMSDNWLWQEKPFSKGQAWVDLLLFANHKPAKILLKGQMIDMARGQQARSEVTLAESWGWSRGKVRRFLKTLENDSMIVQQTSNATSIITICNYSTFQDGDTPDRTADGTAGSTAPGTAPEHQTVHSEEVKECNNEKKVKKKTSARAAPCPRPDEIPEKLWLDFLAVRKAKRLPLTETAMNGIIREAGIAGFTLEQALTICGERGWAGFKASWDLGQTPGQKQMPYSQTTADNLKATEGWMPPEMRNGKQ